MPTADFSKNALVPEIHTCFEPITATWQYIVADPETHEAVVIDSVLDFNPTTSRISTASADNLLAIISKHDLKVIYIMETHAHADHLTAAHYIQQQLVWKGQPKPSISVGKRIDQVQATFARKYNIDASELTGVFDHLWDDNEKFSIGNLRGEVLYLPGHTPDHVGYRIEENVFTGDSIFNPDVGSARADFPGGSVTDLYNSTQTLLSLPSHFRLYTGHDYPPESREMDECGVKIKAYTTVEEQLRENKHVKKGTAQEDFVNWRAERDAMLGEPRLLHQAMQVNVRGGRLPKATVSGDRFLSIPMKVSADVLMLMG